MKQKWRKRLIITAVISGLIIRLVLAFSYGTVDMEWWKAFGTYALKNEISTIYGDRDDVILSLFQKGYSYGKVIEKIQTNIYYEGFNTYYHSYVFQQPPIYIYSIAISTYLYFLVNPVLSNTRLFNFFLNLEPIFSSAFLTVLIYSIVKKLKNKKLGRLAGILYWFHPGVILNAPIQGYRDSLVAFFSVFSLFALYNDNLKLGSIFTLLSALTKPQGILITPILYFQGLIRYNLRKNFQAYLISLVIILILLTPFIVSGRMLSLILGLSTIVRVNTDLSGSPNIWYIAQWIILAWRNNHKLNILLHNLVSQPFGHVTLYEIRTIFHIDLSLIGLILFLLYTLVNLYFFYKKSKKEAKKALFIFSALQVYSYVMLTTAIHINHYFSLIPLLTISLFLKPEILKQYGLICLIYFLFDLFFYGVDRDKLIIYKVLELHSLIWIPFLLSGINFYLFIKLTRQIWFENKKLTTGKHNVIKSKSSIR